MRWVVGIDSAKDRVDLVLLRDGAYADHVSIDAPKEIQSNRSASLGFMRERVDAVIGSWAQSPHVFVEDAIMVKNLRVAIQLAHTVGMLLSLPYRCEIVTIDSWKMVAIGKGGVSKEQVRAGIVRRMPATDALYGKRQDLFDATGIAIYGDAVLRRR